MDLNRQLFLFKMVLFMSLVGLAISNAPPLNEKMFSLGIGSASIMGVQESEETNCPIDFTTLNYTVITSQCKPPEYNATLCCSAFKEFACPLAPQINNIKNNTCASSMFKTLHTKGNYKPGMFRNKCRESNLGLSCEKTTFH